VHVRLVKGAYVEKTGAHPHGEATDIAFLRLGFRLAQSGASWSMATHDGRLREALLLALGTIPVEQLLGVRPEMLHDLHHRVIPTRFVPTLRARLVPLLDAPSCGIPPRLIPAAGRLVVDRSSGPPLSLLLRWTFGFSACSRSPVLCVLIARMNDADAYDFVENRLRG
jgi:hypothetical protein